MASIDGVPQATQQEGSRLGKSVANFASEFILSTATLALESPGHGALQRDFYHRRVHRGDIRNDDHL